jgi:hypothetical protein
VNQIEKKTITTFRMCPKSKVLGRKAAQMEGRSFSNYLANLVNQDLRQKKLLVQGEYLSP